MIFSVCVDWLTFLICNFSECLSFSSYYELFADINKFLWMVRIGGSTERGSHIKEWDYYSPSGEFRVDKEGSPTLLNCLMYKMCYYRFGQVYTEGGGLNSCVTWNVSKEGCRTYAAVTPCLLSTDCRILTYLLNGAESFLRS